MFDRRVSPVLVTETLNRVDLHLDSRHRNRNTLRPAFAARPAPAEQRKCLGESVTTRSEHASDSPTHAYADRLTAHIDAPDTLTASPGPTDSC